MGGPPWEKPELYRKHSPSEYVEKLETPTLVIHGELDYRVPIGQGLSMFTALQRRKVPSELLVFPDEGHWIGKPKNYALWMSTMQRWFEKYLR
jgi:dipeptidyl aminopeptidase/acylaminoacyl peptidase